MKEIEVNSIGVIPISRSETGEYLFLIVKHKAGHWSFPKGTSEVRESELETAQRELYEETGIRNVELQKDKQFTEKYSFEETSVLKHKTVISFIGFTSDINAETPSEFRGEILQTRWLPYHEAYELLTYKESKGMLKEVNDYLSDKSKSYDISYDLL